MSRSTTESDIEKVITYLKKIHRASDHMDELVDLAGKGKRMARILEEAKDEVHRHWEQD
jgi:hypothetical protein